jgi:hypothetical protein
MKWLFGRSAILEGMAPFDPSGSAAPMFAFGVRVVAIGQDHFPFRIRGAKYLLSPTSARE